MNRLPITTTMPTCKLDTDGDGNCPLHPNGCLTALAAPTREEISNAMNLAGGSFIRALAPSLLYADEVNYAKLEAAFPDEFRNYTQMALAFRERLQETAPVADDWTDGDVEGMRKGGE